MAFRKLVSQFWVCHVFQSLSESRLPLVDKGWKYTCMLNSLSIHTHMWASQVAQWVKNLPAVQEMQEKWIQFLVQEDPLEEGTATHSSILAWRIPWTEEPGGLQSVGHKEWDVTKVTEHTHTPLCEYCWSSLHFFISFEQITDCPLFQTVFSGMFLWPPALKNRDSISSKQIGRMVFPITKDPVSLISGFLFCADITHTGITWYSLLWFVGIEMQKNNARNNIQL